jgi:hypothetical protein
MISSQPASKKKLPLMLFPPSVSRPLVQRELLPAHAPLPAPAPSSSSLNVMKDGPVEKKTNRRGGKRGGRARKMTFKNVIDIDGISKYAKNHPAPAPSPAPSHAPSPAPAPPSQHSSTLLPSPSPLAPLQKKYVSSWAKLAPSHHKAIQIDESEICLPLPLMPEGFNSQVSALDANNYFKAQLRSVILSVAL